MRSHTWYPLGPCHFFSSLSFSWLARGSLLTTPAPCLAQRPACPSRPIPLTALTSCPPGSLGTCPRAPQRPHPFRTAWCVSSCPEPVLRRWLLGLTGGGGGTAGAEVGEQRRLEEDAAPLRCHRRVAGKQLVPAPFRPAPLATRNTMHNNQARAWSRATRRGRGRRGPGRVGRGGGARVTTPDRSPGLRGAQAWRSPRRRSAPQRGAPGPPRLSPLPPASRSLQSSFPLTLFQATSPSHLTIRGPSFSQ